MDSTSSSSSNRSYAQVLTKSSGSDSNSSSSRDWKKWIFSKNPFNWNNTVVITRRLFHDDWIKIMFNLKKQIGASFTFKPFHPEKALVSFNESVHAKLLCNNTEWTTVGTFYVKFETSSPEKHSSMKLIPSCRGWLSFRGIHIHAWAYDTFLKIEKACGGFIAVAKETIEMTDLLEAKIKVCYNYSGFILAFIRINDQKGNFFTVQTYSLISGKWLMER